MIKFHKKNLITQKKNIFINTYPTLKPHLKKSPKSIHAIARNPILDLQPIGIQSNSDMHLT